MPLLNIQDAANANRAAKLSGWIQELESQGFSVRVGSDAEIPPDYARPADVIFVTSGRRTQRFIFGPDLPRFSPVGGIVAQFPVVEKKNGATSAAPVTLRPISQPTSAGSSGFGLKVETRALAAATSTPASVAATGGAITGQSTFSRASQIEDSIMPVTRSLLPVAPRGFSDIGMQYDLSGFGTGLTGASGGSAGTALGPWDVINQTVQTLLPKLPLPGSSTAGQIGSAAGSAAGGALSRIGTVALGAARGLKGPAKIFAMLTAAGLTADQISRLISSGAVSLAVHRKRGISATELRGFNRVTSLLHRVGMVPARLGSRSKIHHHRKR